MDIRFSLRGSSTSVPSTADTTSELSSSEEEEREIFVPPVVHTSSKSTRTQDCQAFRHTLDGSRALCESCQSKLWCDCHCFR